MIITSSYVFPPYRKSSWGEEREERKKQKGKREIERVIKEKRTLKGERIRGKKNNRVKKIYIYKVMGYKKPEKKYG